ncbi:hypothetical protein THAOC_11513 [Thalassiosira oceanica]|uniref:MYND-type domain-containing protein n=1 Tax=Thalassiosira oceanica TaxID=159749 RepID=K0SQ28_THAOC|nr:hypothetical protein THAOC_11513 [Thalassiosira oceanica]|eukprot:EJK67450.1 hypothetical protein THAOC_11513 [Thalassiosira oceanica]
MMKCEPVDRKDDGDGARPMMSCVPAEESDEACANCGKPGSDIVKLKKCNACRLVKYCSVDCQKAHRKQHKKACKQRAAELKDERLYNQGHERPEGDFCPICSLPIPLPMENHSVFMSCCMKSICNGCSLATQKRGMFDCAFCRSSCPDDDADVLASMKARVTKKDPAAMTFLGQKHCYGKLGLQKDMRRAIELWTEAAELGSVGALYHLGISHRIGNGVEEDQAKAVEFYERAALEGHAQSRHRLGIYEGLKMNFNSALKHLMISANMGLKDSLELIQKLFIDGIATKEQYAQALEGYQVAVEEMKSHDRDEAERILGTRKQRLTRSD